LGFISECSASNSNLSLIIWGVIVNRDKYPLRRQYIESIPDGVKGLYGFWCRETGRCIYVGKTEEQTIKERLLQEWKNSHNETLKLWIMAFGNHLDICYLPVNRKERIDRAETTLIQMWNPEANLKKRSK